MAVLRGGGDLGCGGSFETEPCTFVHAVSCCGVFCFLLWLVLLGIALHIFYDMGASVVWVPASPTAPPALR